MKETMPIENYRLIQKEAMQVGEFRKRNIITGACEVYLSTLNATGKVSPHLADRFKGVVWDFCNNFIDMVNADFIGADDYFHCKANYEAAIRGEEARINAFWMGVGRELFDFYNNIAFRNMSPIAALKDGAEDLGINRYGREQALSDKDFNDASEACKKYLIEGLGKEWW